MFPRLIINWHHELVERQFMRIYRREIHKLIVRMPPRHTKSLFISRAVPAWWLGQNPEDEIISATYAGELALDHGRAVRNWMATERYQGIFPNVSLASDSRSSSRFNTNKDGIYISVGIGGAITGRGANCLLMDDLYKDRAAADSKAIRKQVLDFYEAVASTRLQPNAVEILTMTSWNDSGLDSILIKKGIEAMSKKAAK